MSKTARQAATGYRPSGRQCAECGMRGWHKLGCSQRDPERVALPATRDAGGVVTVCQRPCRCGPDMCADSVACPRGAVC